MGLLVGRASRAARENGDVDEPLTAPIDWATAQDAYGPAAAVPSLLARAAADPHDSDAWDDLWSSLCHQGTVYEASFLAIPTLAAMARSATAAAYSQPLNLLASIAGSTDVCGTLDTRGRYAAEFSSCLPAAHAYAAAAANDSDFCYALSVVAGLRGEPTWHEVLTFVADGEAFPLCPVCGVDLRLALDTQPPRVSLSWGDGPDGPELVRADRDAIRGFGVELLSLASRCSRPAVTGRLLALLGVCVCPDCEAEVSPAESLGLGSAGDAAESRSACRSDARLRRVSRDIVVQDLPDGITGAGEIPDGWMPSPLPFGHAEVVAAVLELASDADVTDPTWLHVTLPGVDIEVNVADRTSLSSFALHVRAADQPAADAWIHRLLDRLGARAFDTWSESGIFQP